MNSIPITFEIHLVRLTSLNKDEKEKMILKKDRESDKLDKTTFSANGIRTTVSCKSCGAYR